MNEAIQNILTRRSIRSYQDKPVPKEIINQLIECAKHAPSAMNKQPWNFIVVTNKDLIKEMSDSIKKKMRLILKFAWFLRLFVNKHLIDHLGPYAKSEKDVFFYNAPCIIFITAKKSDWSVIDCSCAAQNIMLAASSLGLGTCWIGFARFISKKMLKKLQVPDKHKVIASIIVGYPKVTPKNAPERKSGNVSFI